MLDRLTSIRTFITVAQCGSFVTAAEKTGMSPQMVARHIAGLEKQLSARLINRTTRRQSLTPAGSLYYRRCTEIIKDLDNADAEASGASGIPAGTLRINAPVSFGRYALMDFLSYFLQHYPKITTELTLSDEVINPAAESFDLVIRIGEPDKNLRYAARPLPPYRLIVCASPQYLATRGRPAHPAELSDHDCLGFSLQAAGLTHQWPFILENQILHFPVNSRLSVNDWGALLEAALKGNGILMGYDKALELPLRQGQLVPVLEHYPVPAKPVYLLYDPSRTNEIRYQTFITRLCNFFNSAT